MQPPRPARYKARLSAERQLRQRPLLAFLKGLLHSSRVCSRCAKISAPTSAGRRRGIHQPSNPMERRSDHSLQNKRFVREANTPDVFTLYELYSVTTARSILGHSSPSKPQRGRCVAMMGGRGSSARARRRESPSVGCAEPAGNKAKQSAIERRGLSCVGITDFAPRYGSQHNTTKQLRESTSADSACVFCA